jgi:hypothetical protein
MVYLYDDKDDGIWGGGSAGNWGGGGDGRKNFPDFLLLRDRPFRNSPVGDDGVGVSNRIFIIFRKLIVGALHRSKSPHSDPLSLNCATINKRGGR